MTKVGAFCYFIRKRETFVVFVVRRVSCIRRHVYSPRIRVFAAYSFIRRVFAYSPLIRLFMSDSLYSYIREPFVYSRAIRCIRAERMIR